MELKQTVQMMRRQMLIISILSVVILLFLLSYSFRATSEPFASVNFPQSDSTKLSSLASHLNPNDDGTIIFSKNEYLNKTHTPSEGVIAYLVASFNGDPRVSFNPYPRLREKIAQLDERLGDNHTTDVIVFHTGYPSAEEMVSILTTSRRQVQFVNIDRVFYKVAPGFQPHIKNPTWSQRGKWNYHHMCYFWFKEVFELHIIQRYRYLMRLDDDSQILGKWPNVFELIKQNQSIYIANRREVDYEYVLPGITRIRNLTQAYVKENKITIRNPQMYADVFNHSIEIPNYWNNIEVVDLKFMRRKDVVDFIRVIDESQGIFLYRWGDAPLRYVTLAIYANATEVLHREKLGLAYCHPC